MLLYSCRVPWGVANPRPEANAGCRACCEGSMSASKLYIICEVKVKMAQIFEPCQGRNPAALRFVLWVF